ncbi:putative effector [Maize bushy stunt phytoplasma]|uniref:Effector n=1 Tax=Maize bushy stunt phytoplasma TaxID=202462 RepID=A0ABN4RYN5_9MOLU|nr:hypothetical protein [Maize bushy stunt phytoplasma]AOF54816.1 putative effector [Maize bushy stunt phytoplasma]
MSFWENFFNITKQFAFFNTFFMGILSGVILSSFIYCLLSLCSVKKTLAAHRLEKTDVSQQEIIKLIEAKKKYFKEKMKKDKDNFGHFLITSIQELILEISSQFYPSSKYPYLELTIDESLILIFYINQRVDKVFQNKILIMFRKMTLKRIFVIREMVVKKNMIQKYQKVAKVTNTFNNIRNFFNPFHWFKKIIFDKPLGLIYHQIGVSLIAITGEEVYKIYSKKIFETEEDLEKDLQKVLDTISKVSADQSEKE